MAEKVFPEKLVSERIDKIHEMLYRCNTLEKTIEGLTKLQRKLLAELKFLTSLTGDTTRIIKQVAKTVLKQPLATKRLRKIGQGNFGEKDIIHQAKELLEASKQHPVNYSPPVVIISCCQGITESLAKALRSTGICVKGKLLPDPEKGALAGTCNDDTFTDNRLPAEFYEFECASVNLDVTTMIAYVSALTNGGCGFIFKEAILTKQAKEEQHNPVLPKLKAFFKGLT
ncbi:UPF0415 protein C7orf25-like [Stylophora pistillata]|uniref:UPF0415 protein C7orf25-like n=1 Tax=Stylophora pistillata TaxID=50429 RepID=A0A2B4SPX1_STYPI|nr:UPF0415 protein C7orf25-like [Stylophora pistillata]